MNCAVITTSRADYGLLKSTLSGITDSKKLDLQLIVSGTHLAPSHGHTITEIKRDGFSPDWCVDLVIDSQSKVSRAQSMALGINGFATAYEHLEPDILILLGDRFEMFAAACAGVVMGVPIAHIAGGDITEGAYDDSFRHGITKAAALHFTTNEDAARRVRQMGEPDDRIYMVGSPGLDPLETMQWMDRQEVFDRIGIKPGKRSILVTYHPVTRDAEATSREIRALCAAIRQLPDDTSVVITGTNIDTQADEVRIQLEALADQRPNTIMRASLGHTLYLNALNTFDVVVGNSSSGLYEAPSVKTPTINIGNRQKGRPKATSVIDVEGDEVRILQAMEQAFFGDYTDVKSPYGNGDSGKKIIAALEKIKGPAALLIKPFADLDLR